MSYLTIGIPTYNGAFNFRDLIRSVSLLGLNYNEYELLIVDNASTDNTDEVIGELSKTLNNLRYFRQKENVGRIQNWNKVIDLAQGDYLILMNVNDRFVEFDLRACLNKLDNNPEMGLIMSDLIYQYPHVTYSYPNWKQSGEIELNSYIKETFLKSDILEFYSFGVLHQHIYRLKTIKEHHIKFNELIPRTTDRVFVAEVIAKGNRQFFYTGKPMVKWVANETRFHFAAQQNFQNFDFNALWLNEYKANLALAVIAGVKLSSFLESQAIYAKYLHYTYLIKNMVDFFKKGKPTAELEEVSALAYFYFIRVQCKVNNIKLNEMMVDYCALKKKLKKPLRRFNLIKKADRKITFNDPGSINVIANVVASEITSNERSSIHKVSL